MRLPPDAASSGPHARRLRISHADPHRGRRQRITEWAQSAVSDYLSRFPRDFRVELREIRTEPRAGQTPARLMAAEAERILAAIEPDDFVVVLDEHGKDLTTMGLARHFSHWRADGETPVFVIGRPDGLAPEAKARANPDDPGFRR